MTIQRSLGLISEVAIDPVCGMSVDPASAAGSYPFEGATYHFCSRHCLAKFQADPQRYLKGNVREESACCSDATHSSARAAGTQYTCPMHPEIASERPGSCPKCGMALEAKVPALGEEDDSELRDMSRRFALSLVLAIPAFALAMAPMIPGVHLPHWLISATNWIELILATPVAFWASWPFFQRAWQALRHRTSNMFTLIVLGMLAAWSYSAVATLEPSLFPDEFLDAHGTIPTYFEAVTTIATLVLLGQVSNFAPDEKRARPFAAFSVLHPRRLGESSGMAARLPYRSPRCASAIGCA